VRRALVLAALALSACSDWPPITASPPLSIDPRLGMIVTETSIQRPVYIDAAASTGQLYVGVYIGLGLEQDLTVVLEKELRFYAVDTTTGTSTQLPKPPIAATNRFFFGTVIGDRGLLVATRDTKEAAFFDGTAWTKLPNLPYEPSNIIARSATEVAFRLQGVVSVLHAGAWQQVVANAKASFGPWDAARGVRLITIDATTCVSFLDLVNATQSTPSCQRTSMVNLNLDSINGTADDFQVLEAQGVVNGIVWHFSNGQWDTGALATLTHTRPTPRFTGMIASPPDEQPTSGGLTPAGAIVSLRGGQFERVLLEKFTAAITCGCDRETDRTCDCVRRELTSGFTVDGDASQGWLFGVSDLGTHRRFFARHFAFPDTAGFNPLTCEPSCATGKVCLATSLTKQECVNDASHVSQTNLTNNPALQFQVLGPIEPAPVAMEVTLADGGADDQVTLLSTLPNVTLTARPHERYRVTLTADGWLTRSFEVTMPDTFMTADLGKIWLARGVLLGEGDGALNAIPTAIGAPSHGGWMVLPVSGQWTLVQAVDGGVSQRALGPVPATPLRPRVDPTGRFMLVVTPTGLQLFDAQTIQPVGAELPGTQWNTGSAIFSMGSDAVALDEGTASTVLRFSASGLSRAFSAMGTTVDLSGDGTAVLVRIQGQYAVATAAGTLGRANYTRPLISRDGTHVYDQVGTVVPFSLIDHADDGGVSTISTRATFVTVDPRAGGVVFTENVNGQGVVRTESTTLIDGGIYSMGSGLGRQGLLYVQASSTATTMTPVVGSTETLMGAYAFEERETGQAIATPTCTGACEFVLFGEQPARRIKAGQGVVFGAGDDRAFQPLTLRIDAVDPVTGAVTMGTRFTPMGGPMPMLDRRFNDPNAGGQARMDSFGLPCMPFDWPTWRYEVSSSGVVTAVDGGLQRACVSSP